VITKLLLEAMEESQQGALDIGDEALAIMLGDIIEGYRGGWVNEKHARIALFSAERRIQKMSNRG
jgi:hypothetical protein